jgi:hypothetical protein
VLNDALEIEGRFKDPLLGPDRIFEAVATRPRPKWCGRTWTSAARRLHLDRPCSEDTCEPYAARQELRAFNESSSAISSSPQEGFLLAICRMSSRIFFGCAGRPRRRDFHRHSCRNSARCQRMKVSGLTMKSALRQSKSFDNQTSPPGTAQADGGGTGSQPEVERVAKTAIEAAGATVDRTDDAVCPNHRPTAERIYAEHSMFRTNPRQNVARRASCTIRAERAVVNSPKRVLIWRPAASKRAAASYALNWVWLNAL